MKNKHFALQEHDMGINMKEHYKNMTEENPCPYDNPYPQIKMR